MKTTFIVLAVVLVGCGRPVFLDLPAPTVYSSDCVTIESYRPLVPAKVDAQVANAKRRYDRVFGTGSWCKEIGTVVITVRPETNYWYCQPLNAPDFECLGFTDWTTRDIQLIGNGMALLHEAFHVHELKTHVANPHNDHFMWQEKGFNGESGAFVGESIGSVTGPGWLAPSSVHRAVPVSFHRAVPID